jgi:SAM-dependent methyltransferase
MFYEISCTYIISRITPILLVYELNLKYIGIKQLIDMCANDNKNIKPYFLYKSFIPSFEENRMRNVDNVKNSREDFIMNKPTNLSFLLEKRYIWMNNWIKKDSVGIEVGCGNGLSKLFIKSRNYLLTDFTDFEWIDLKVDALNMPFNDNSLDFIVSCNVIHHLSKPSLFFKECHRILKPHGFVLIHEVNASFFMRLIIRILKHEGYNYDVDPFDEYSNCSISEKLWSGNNVVPNLLFNDMDKFEHHFKFKCKHKQYREFAIFLLSGGVTAKVPTINLNRFILHIIDFLDIILIKISKDLFALGVQVVLQKTTNNSFHPS